MENDNKNIPVSDEEIKEVSGGVISATRLEHNTFICPVCKERLNTALLTVHNNVEMCFKCKTELSGK